MTIYYTQTKKETSDFYGNISFDPVGQTKISNHFILSSYFQGLLNLMCTRLFPLSSGISSSKRDTFYFKWQPEMSDDEKTSKNPKFAY